MYPGPDTFLQYYIGPYLQARHLKQGRLGIKCNVQFLALIKSTQFAKSKPAKKIQDFLGTSERGPKPTPSK